MVQPVRIISPERHFRFYAWQKRLSFKNAIVVARHIATCHDLPEPVRNRLIPSRFLQTYKKAITVTTYSSAISRFAPSQWKTSLQSNAFSHWLGTTENQPCNRFTTYMQTHKGQYQQFAWQGWPYISTQKTCSRKGLPIYRYIPIWFCSTLSKGNTVGWN